MMKKLPVLCYCIIATVACLAPKTLGETKAADEEKKPLTYFTFNAKGKRELLATRPEMPGIGPYYPCLVDMTKLKGFPYRFALYFSTDHGHRGGIWLYLCNEDLSKPENWVSYDQAVAQGKFDYLKDKPEANPIFTDNVQGSQTETAHLNIVDGELLMTYHNLHAGRCQSTLLAKSPDGVNFRRFNGEEDSVIIDYEEGQGPGDGHTGYLRWRVNPFPEVKHKYVGYSLYGGGWNFHFALWGSDDAMNWKRLALFKPLRGHTMDIETYYLQWIEMDVTSIWPLPDGNFVAICVFCTPAPGKRNRSAALYEIFLGKDGKTLKRESRPVMENTWNMGQPLIHQDGDSLHLIYTGRTGIRQKRRNTLIYTTGSFNKNADESDPLAPKDQQRHFFQE